MENHFMDRVLLQRANCTHLETLVDFQMKMAKETESLDLDQKTLEEGVCHILTNNQIGYYLLAQLDQHPIACMLILSEWSDWRNAECLWVHSVYIEKNYRRSGLFSLMYEKIKKEVLASSRYSGIRLFVDKRNTVAHSTYKNLGMSNEHYDLFEWQK